MRLTRRDALVALAASGLVASASLDTDALPEGDLTDDDVETLVLVAEVLYPSVVEPSREFVETYVAGRVGGREDHRQGLRAALGDVRRTSTRETGREFSALDVDTRGDVLRATGGDRAYPDPDGTAAQRVRYYVINDLLYALYATPTGGELVGSPNPVGYPGGTEAYQRRPGTE